MRFYTDKSLDNIKQLLCDESADMPELRKNLTNSLIEMVEERDKQIKRLEEREGREHIVSQWFDNNKWLGETFKVCFQALAGGLCAIVICAGGVGALIYVATRAAGMEQCQSR